MESDNAIITDLNQKCLNFKHEIDKKLIEINNGSHNLNIDKIKEKILEKHENFGESLKHLEKLINEKITGESQKVWKR